MKFKTENIPFLISPVYPVPPIIIVFSEKQIIEKLEYAIEQHPSFLHVIPESELAAYEADHEKRRYSHKS